MKPADEVAAISARRAATSPAFAALKAGERYRSTDVSVICCVPLSCMVAMRLKAEKGTLDVVFANAGLGNFAPLGVITPEAYAQVFDVNVKGTLFTVQKALPLLKSGSSIILTGSTTGTKGTPAFSIYSASKAAIRNFARSWALDLAGTGIRVNVIVPGPPETPGLMDGLATTGMQNQMVAALIAQTPLGRLGNPAETAAVAAFLASDDSSFMTGSEVFVDGGQAQI